MAETETPEQLVREAKAAYARGDYPAAARLFNAARAGFAGRSDHLSAAETANNASVAYLRADDAEQALAMAEGTPEIFAQAGDLQRQGMALGNLGAALEALERYEEALEAYTESAHVLELAGADQLRADVMTSLSQLQFNLGRRLQALASMQSGMEGVRRPNPKQALIKRLLNIPFEMLSGKRKSG